MTIEQLKAEMQAEPDLTWGEPEEEFAAAIRLCTKYGIDHSELAYIEVMEQIWDAQEQQIFDWLNGPSPTLPEAEKWFNKIAVPVKYHA